MKRIWKINCMEDKYPGMWQRWFKNQCVAVGWPPDDGYHLNGDTEGGKGWATARNAIKKMEEGDFVVVAMKNNKIARIGEIVGKAIEDHQWAPLVPKSKSLPTGEIGRRIFVRWDLTLGPQNLVVINLPEGNRLTNGELRPTVGEVRSQKIEKLKSAVNLPANWVSLLGQFVYEKALSDYIANYPHHLEDGLTPYPDSRIREKVFKDSSRLDVLLIDRDEIPVIVECKQYSPSPNDLKQLKKYMKNLFKETGKKPIRGILVHGGSQKLSKDVFEYLKKEQNIEVLSYKLDIEFRRSNF